MTTPALPSSLKSLSTPSPPCTHPASHTPTCFERVLISCLKKRLLANRWARIRASQHAGLTIWCGSIRDATFGALQTLNLGLNKSSFLKLHNWHDKLRPESAKIYWDKSGLFYQYNFWWQVLITFKYLRLIARFVTVVPSLFSFQRNFDEFSRNKLSRAYNCVEIFNSFDFKIHSSYSITDIISIYWRYFGLQFPFVVCPNVGHFQHQYFRLLLAFCKAGWAEPAAAWPWLVQHSSSWTLRKIAPIVKVKRSVIFLPKYKEFV